MGAGFVRRFSSFPGLEQLTLIEGAAIIDLPPPGQIEGVGVGTVALVGEFADVTFGTTVDTSGNVSTKGNPVEIFSPQDLLNKLGGFDETLGEFGGALGNGFATLRGRRFSRLVGVPVNIASAKGVRYFRHLPGCKSARKSVV